MNTGSKPGWETKWEFALCSLRRWVRIPSFSTSLLATEGPVCAALLRVRLVWVGRADSGPPLHLLPPGIQLQPRQEEMWRWLLLGWRRPLGQLLFTDQLEKDTAHLNINV